MIRSNGTLENCGVSSQQIFDCPPPSNSSSDEGLHTPSQLTTGIKLLGSQRAVLSNRRLKRCVSTPLLPYTSTPQGFRPVSSESPVQIPIVGYEVMEERARFTVYKIKIDNKILGESWFIFRRYTDFVRLNSKIMGDKELCSGDIRECLGEYHSLKLEFPKKALVMPRKRWFGNNFSMSFIEDRIRGLQHFIDTVTSDEELLATITVRQFFCLDEAPAASEIGEESRAIFEALEDTIYQLRKQLKVKEAEIMNMRMSVTSAQEKAVTVSQRLTEVVSCESCGDKVQSISDDLQRVLCLQFSNSGS